ncbi:hypothetical protein ES703_72480 [subsurface metagenome]
MVLISVSITPSWFQVIPLSWLREKALSVPLVAAYTLPLSAKSGAISTKVWDCPVGGLVLLVQWLPPSVLR